MKTGYSFGSLASFVEQINNTTVKLTGDQTIAGSKTFSSNPISSAAQGSGGAYLTRRDFVENLLSYKAPTDSPAFTGNPTAPTAALFDGDTTVATTQFVQRALGNHQSYVWTGDATIQPTWAGCFIWYAGAGTLYLPNYASVSVGATFEIMCTGAGAITAQSGELITLPNGVQINSFTPLAGDIGKFVRLDASWAYSGTNYCATAATGDRSTRPASTQFVRNYLEASPQLAGNVHVEGTVNVTQEFQTTNAIGYRIAYGDYGAFWYFDNWNMYLMFTNSGDKWGGYNGLRPFSADCRTGKVGMSNGVSVAGGLATDSFTVVRNAIIDGGWWRDTQPFSVDGNYASGSVYDVHASQLPTTDSFFPIVGATADSANEGYQVRVKFGVYSTSGVEGWGRKHAGIWVGNGENAAGPKYLYKFNVYGGFYCNAVVADTTITAGTYMKAQNFVSTVADAAVMRLTGGNYGTLFYNDSAETFWILCTNANDQLGGFNNLRPFGINKRTGLVQMYSGLTVAAGLWTDQAHISSTTNSAPTQAAGTNNTTIATTAFVQSMKIEVAKMLYPVGSYYANDIDSTNPATLFGFGTWVRVEGRVLMGCDGTGAGTFGTSGSQGGALTHAHTAYGTALTIAQMPVHGHSIAMGTSGIGDASGGDGRILTSNAEVKEGVSPATYISANDNGSGQTHTHTIANASSLPPYRVVYLWRRTA